MEQPEWVVVVAAAAAEGNPDTLAAARDWEHPSPAAERNTGDDDDAAAGGWVDSGDAQPRSDDDVVDTAAGEAERTSRVAEEVAPLSKVHLVAGTRAARIRRGEEPAVDDGGDDDNGAGIRRTALRPAVIHRRGRC